MLTFGLSVSLLGIAIVFFVLILLVFVIGGLRRLAAYCDGSAVMTKVKAAPQRVVLDRGSSSVADEDELAAVIAAALAAHSAGK